MLIGLGNGNSHDGEGWKPVTPGTGRMVAAADLQLQNRVSTLVADKGLGAFSNEASVPAEPELHRKEHQEEEVTDSRGKLPPAWDGGPYLLI